MDWCQSNGVLPTYFPLIEAEVEAVLPHRITERFADQGPYKMRKIEEQAIGTWHGLAANLDRSDVKAPDDAVASLRRRVEANPQDLSRLVTGRTKDPVPETSDLRIMVMASRLEPKPVYLISRDAHFLGYNRLLEETLRVVVIDGNRVPFLVNQWEASAN